MTKVRPKGSSRYSADVNMRDYHVRAPLGQGFFFSDIDGGFPEYPGASVTTENITYASVNNPALTALKATLVYVTGATNLPVLICGHGYHETVADLNTAENNLTRWARLGFFILAVEGRGNNGSSGTQDDGGRETMDVYDALQYVITNHSGKIALGRYGTLGFSGGGASALLLSTRYPDLFVSSIDFFGISDWGAWYNEQPSRQAGLQAAIGGTPVTKPDEYAARKTTTAFATNFQGYWMGFHDTADVSVAVTHSQAVAAAMVTAGRTDYAYNESTVGSTYRWSHAYPLSTNDLHQAEPLWKNQLKTRSINTVQSSGTLKIAGMLKTKLFTIYMNDGNYLTAGMSRFGTVVYNMTNNTFQITNDSAGTAVISIRREDNGFVATGVLDAAETYTFSPVTLQVDSDTPIMWFDAGSKLLLSGSDVTAIADKTGGPQYQGYALSFITARPGILATDINSLPAIDFVAASTEGLVGARRTDLQGIGAFTYIEVGTGTIIDHGFSANAQTQFGVLSGGSYFYAINNGSAANGSDAGTATYLVRTTIFNGAGAGNSTRLLRRENKVAQTVTFSGTIPATTENSASVFGVGKRSYSANYFTGKIAEFMIFNSVLADVGDKEDILKAKYAI